jgi:hypothetical protein
MDSQTAMTGGPNFLRHCRLDLCEASALRWRSRRRVGDLRYMPTSHDALLDRFRGVWSCNTDHVAVLLTTCDRSYSNRRR